MVCYLQGHEVQFLTSLIAEHVRYRDDDYDLLNMTSQTMSQIAALTSFFSLAYINKHS